MVTISEEKKMCQVGLQLLKEAINWYSELNWFSPPSFIIIRYFFRCPLNSHFPHKTGIDLV